MSVEWSVVSITPARAAALLRNNSINRNIRKVVISAMCRDLVAGHWQFNGDSIRVAENGELLDGQHRLTAIVRSGVDMKTLLVTGLPVSVRATIDSGIKRTMGDRFHMAGVPNANAAAAAVNVLYQLAHRTAAIWPTPSEAQEIFEAHPGLADSVRKARKAFSGSATRLIALHYIGHYTGNGDRSDDFLGVWISGVPTYNNDPAHKVRERIIKLRGTPSEMTQKTTALMVGHSFNMFMAGREIRAIQLPSKIGVPGWGVDDLTNPRHDITRLYPAEGSEVM